MTVTYMGAQTSFDFTVIESPVAGISVTKLPDKSAFYENLDGSWTTRWDEAAQEYVAYYYYYYSIYGLELTVNYTDGTSEAFTYDFSNNGNFNGYQMGCSVDQEASPWTLGGNAVTVTYMGAQTSFDFTVIESPVAGITVTKLPDKSAFYENLDGYWSTRWDETAQEGVPFFYYNYSIYGMELTVNYTDGTNEAFTYDDSNYGYFNGYQMGWFVDQEASPWAIGGNAVTVTYMGAQTSFDFTVIESPVAGIEVTKLPDKSTFIENLDGSWSARWDEAAQDFIPFFYYNYSISGLELTVNYTDGTSEAFTLDDSNNGIFNGYHMGCSVNQDAYPWTVGGNTMTVTYMGAQTSFDFTVIESPVAGIEVTKLPDISTVTENVDGHWRTRWDEATQQDVPYFEYYFDMYGMELTVNYTDGTSEAFTYDDSNYGTFNGYQMGWSVDQEASPWVIGGNAVAVTYMGAQTSFNFTVIEGPVAGIEVTKLPDKSTYIENLDGFWSAKWDEAAQEYVEYYYYYFSIYGMELTVNYTNGTSEAFTYDSSNNGIFNGYQMSWSVDQAASPWILGGNTVPVTYLGAQTSFDITVTENPVASIEVTKLPEKSTFIENVNGSWETRWDEATQQEVPFFYYNFDISGLELTVHYADSTSEAFTVDDSNNGVFNGYHMDYSYESQIIDPWSVGGNAVTVTYMGAQASFDVTVAENPVASIAVTKLPDKSTIFENVDGCWRTRWDEAAQENVPFFYYYFDISGLELTVSYTDGTSEAFTVDNSNGGTFNSYHMDWSDGDQYDNPWTVGGNAVPVTYMGAQTSFDVTVAENPVAGIEVTKLPDNSTFIENVNGSWETRWDEVAQENVPFFYYYFNTSGLELTVNYTDGTSEAFTYNYSNNGIFNGYHMDYSYESQYNDPWTVGGNTVMVTYMGAQTSFDFTVIENPVASIAVTKLPGKLIYIENADGSWRKRWDEATQNYINYFQYNISLYGMELTVNYTDGTSAVFTYNNSNNGRLNGYYVSYVENQSSAPWSVGSNAVTVTYLGAQASFDVTVAENPVASIEVTKLPDKSAYLENCDGDWEIRWDEDTQQEVPYFYYNVSLYGLEMKVNYTDGSSAVYTVDSNYGGSFNGYSVSYLGNQYASPWTLGGNAVTVIYMGAQTSYDVTVTESPVAGIEVTKLPDKTAYIVGVDSGINRNGMEITVHYKDGTSAVWSYDVSASYFNGYYFQFSYGAYVLGTNTISVTYMGTGTTFEVTGTESPVASIEVTKKPVKSVLIENADGYWDTVWDETAQQEVPYFRYNDSPYGMELTVHYTDSTSEVFTYDYSNDGSFNGNQMGYYSGQEDAPWTAGSNTVTVRYMGAQTSFNLTVTESPVAGIEVTKLPDKTEYIAGSDDGINPAGMEITVHYKDGTSAVWNYNEDGPRFNGYNVSLSCDDFVVGANIVRIKYMGAETTFDVTGKASPVASIEVTKLPDKTEYTVGADFGINRAGMEIMVYYKDGTSAVWSYDDDGSYLNGFYFQFLHDNYILGTNTVTVTYMGSSTAFQVTGKESPVTGIEVTKLPDKTVYIVGADYDVNLAGMEVTVHYKDGTSAVWSYDEDGPSLNGYDEDGPSLNGYDFYFNNNEFILGRNTIIVRYMNTNTAFAVTGEMSPVSAIEVTKQPDKTEYIVGADYGINLAGMEITVHYKDATSAVWSYDEDGPKMNGYYFEYLYNGIKLGGNTVWISYLGAATTFSVTGTENPVSGIEVTKLPDKSTLIDNLDGYWDIRWDETTQREIPFFRYNVSFIGMELTVHYTNGTSDVFTGDGSNEGSFNGYKVYYIDNQYNSPWTAGSNTATIRYMGAQTSFDVTVVPVVSKVNGTSTVIDDKNRFIYGIEPGTTSLEGLVTVPEGCEITYEPAAIGTGTVVNVTRNNGTDKAVEIVASYTIVIFGDVTGDGIVDGNDADRIVDIDNYALPRWNQFTDAAFIKAGDLFRDGVADLNDACVITDVSNYHYKIDQTKGTYSLA